MTKEEFQVYVSIDDDLMTSDIPTTEDIVESDGDTDEYEESEPSTCTMLEFAERMQTFFEARDVSEDIFWVISLLPRTIA